MFERSMTCLLACTCLYEGLETQPVKWVLIVILFIITDKIC